MRRIATQLLASVLLLLTILFSQNSSAQSKVVLAGTFQDELGCPGDWQPGCDATALTYDAGSGLWSGTFVLDAGYWQYKVAYNGTWDESYGEDGGPDNIWLYVPVKSSVTFVYDPVSHLATSTPYSGVPAKEVQLFGQLQDELGCPGDWVWECTSSALSYNLASGKWEGTFALPAGCYKYVVKVTPEQGNIRLYGENGGAPEQNLQLYLPQAADVTFSYDATTHLVTTSPYGSPGPGIRKVSLYGTLQDEIGCQVDWEYFCDNAGLTYNAASGKWEGKFTLPAGCYIYQVKEESGCDVSNVFYGEGGVQDGPYIQLSVPETAEVSFVYDPVTHLISSTPYGGPQLNTVTLVGTFQTQMGCTNEWDPYCTASRLSFNESSGKWEGTFNLPAGCYSYQVAEAIGCDRLDRYGEGGVLWGNDILLSVPVGGAISFSYDPLTHTISSTPYDRDQIISVSLLGDLQSELGCAEDWTVECSNSQLVYDEASGKWTGKYTLPAGCYRFMVVEKFNCGSRFYGEGGSETGNPIPLYLTAPQEVTFIYDRATHLISTLPDATPPQAITSVSLYGTLQSESGCADDNNFECNSPALSYNEATGKWEGTFDLPAGCYSYQVKETFGCNVVNLYGEGGVPWGNNVQLYVPETAAISFSYDPLSHTISSTPYSGAPQELMKVSLLGTLQSETGCAGDYDFYCDNPALAFDAASGTWTGKYTLPAGCYTYWVKEYTGCDVVKVYGKEGTTEGSPITLYLPEEAEVTFIYNAETHLISTAPYGAPEGVTKVSLLGDLQTEMGCAWDFEFECEKSTLTFNPASGKWEGTFTLPAGCYYYHVKETVGCDNVTIYGQNGQPGGNLIQLSLSKATEVTFIYDAASHTITTTAAGGEGLATVALVGSLQTSLGCAANWDVWGCDNAALTYNAASGLWEGTFTLEAGCYRYAVKEVKACGYGVDVYGQNGNIGAHEYYNYYLLYVPEKGEVTIAYDPVTHLASSEYNNICPSTTVVIAGTFQDELGCPGDWMPDCDATRLTWGATNKVWTGTFDIPAGYWEYKVVHDNSWNESYGQNGSPEPYNNIPLYLEAPANITFIYNPVTHLVDLVYNTVDLCVTAYYDPNGNGVRDTSENIPMPGVAFTLSNGMTQYTGSDGTTCFTKLTPGIYTLEAVVPDGYLPTLAPQTIELLKPRAISFGVAACLGGAGAQNLSFWMTKHGEVLFNALPVERQEEILAKLRAFNLRTAEGGHFDPWSYEQLRVWLQKANAKNMAYKLSAEMAALFLNVETGMLQDRTIYSPGWTVNGVKRDFISVQVLIEFTNYWLKDNAYGGDGNRAHQEYLRKLLEDVNADRIFVQLQPCNFVTSANNEVTREARVNTPIPMVWPNPSGSHFTLRPANTGSDGEVQIRVMDIDGKLVYAVRGNALKEYRFGEGFIAGMYFVEIVQDGNRSTIKVVKQ